MMLIPQKNEPRPPAGDPSGEAHHEGAPGGAEGGGHRLVGEGGAVGDVQVCQLRQPPEPREGLVGGRAAAEVPELPAKQPEVKGGVRGITQISDHAPRRHWAGSLWIRLQLAGLFDRNPNSERKVVVRTEIPLSLDSEDISIQAGSDPMS